MARRLSNSIAVDDAPFPREHRGDVGVVGVAFTRTRLDGVMTGKLRRDGANATQAIATLISSSPFAEHAQIVLLGGITFGGFNVADIHGLHERLDKPILVLARKRPRYADIRRALLEKVPGGARKWALIEAAGEMEPCAALWVQRVGLELDAAAQVIEDLRVHGKLPEPVRVAHLIAGAFADGVSRGRA
ncbi:DUF99 family protein [Pseudenhygromyxa sp. WMMC2535]|uniref:endonuclease dU n=1 Tax=Pseudenhygromyxa sp. WMMC2535 TaxID=2712867 RepID=UPI0015538B4A|nr:DUF99 family protein [Pseudenhygromyxa sp. WMMC2535]NVB42991.1 DUF99 family protein [Pseudenhygromyxa sp. WMMC2535]